MPATALLKKVTKGNYEDNSGDDPDKDDEKDSVIEMSISFTCP